MYWADLSRLSGSLPRIVTELFTLLFRLSLLGRDTVRIAAAHDSAWQWTVLRKAQTTLDWLFSRVLGLIVLQLAMLALVIIPMGALRGQAEAAVPVIVAVVLFVAYLAACYHGPGIHRSWIAALVAAVRPGPPGGSSATSGPRSRSGSPAVLARGAQRRLRLGMKSAEARFPFTAPIGWAMWAVVMVTTIAGAGAHATSFSGLEIWVDGALLAFEVVLLAMVASWALIGIALVVCVLAGAFAARTDTSFAHAIVSTGRLGVFASGSFFLVIVMAVWAMLCNLLELAVGYVRYRPWKFDVPARTPRHGLGSRISCTPATKTAPSCSH